LLIFQLEDAIVAAPAGGTTSVIDNELDARSLGDAETSASSSQAPDVAMVSHEDQDNRLSLSDGLLEEHTLQTQPSPQLTSHFTGIESKVSWFRPMSFVLAYFGVLQINNSVSMCLT
jgi:hypothetical protein